MIGIVIIQAVVQELHRTRFTQNEPIIHAGFLDKGAGSYYWGGAVLDCIIRLVLEGKPLQGSLIKGGEPFLTLIIGRDSSVR